MREIDPTKAMSKTLVIAVRDYNASVRTKSFLISLILMPVLIFGGAVIGRIAQDAGDTRPKKIAVIDRTAADPGSGALASVLIEKAKERNEKLLGEDGKYRRAPYEIEPISITAETSPEELDRLRFELSERVRGGELFAFAEIGPKVVEAPPEDAVADAFAAAGVAAGATTRPALADVEAADDGDGANPFAGVELPPEVQRFLDERGIRYTSENTTDFSVRQWIAKTLTPEIQGRRFAAAQLPPEKVLNLSIPPTVQSRALAVQGEGGEIAYEDDPNPIVSFIIPIFLLFLMFTVIMTASQPLTTNVIEEKQLRIAEVLLGSVRPFELMLGKLIGTVGVSLTLAGIYAAGGLFLAGQFDVLDAIDVSTLLWFLLFAGIGTLMYGALFVAVGAAVTNLKEAQNLLTPVILLVVAPMMVFMPIVTEPTGTLSRAFTYFPLTTPMTAVLRLAVPPGMPLWEKLAAAGLSLVTTLVLVWLAGRIFRFGMLHTDKAAAMRDMARWVVRG